MVERSAGLQIERGAAKPVCDAGADEEGVTEYEGLSASRKLDRIFDERTGEEIAGMPANNSIFEGSVLWGVGSGRPRRLRREGRRSVAVRARQRADHADESVAMPETEKRRSQFGEGFAKSFEPFPRGAPHGRGKRVFKGRVCINVARPRIDIAYQKTPQPCFD